MAKNILIVLLIVLLIRMIYENKLLTTTYYTVSSAKLPAGFKKKRIVFLSDLHNNSFGRNNEKLLNAIHDAKPDVIIIGGDMIVGRPDMDHSIALNLIKELGKDYTVFYGKGNHEQKLSSDSVTCDPSYEEYEERLKQSNVRLLSNESEKYDGLIVAGLDISIDFYRKRNRPVMSAAYLENTIKKTDGSQFTILLAHDPVYFKDYVNWGADLVLAGHVHGGIMRIPGLGGMISPRYTFFPHYDYGEFKEENSTMILSRGLGSHTIKLRLNNIPEIVVIDLARKGQ